MTPESTSRHRISLEPVLLRSIVALTLGTVVVGCNQAAPPKAPPPSTLRTETRRASLTQGRQGSEVAEVAAEPVDAPAPPVPDPALPRSCDQIRAGILASNVMVSVPAAPIFIQPRKLEVPLATEPAGTVLPVKQLDGEWYLIRFADRRWGARVGYIWCGNVQPSAVSVDAGTPSPRAAKGAAPPE